MKPPSRENRTEAIDMFEQALALDQTRSRRKAGWRRADGTCA